MKNEYSKEIDIRRIGVNNSHYSLCADDKECNALAARFGIVRLNYLKAEVDVRLSDRDEYTVEGSFSSSVRQVCGVTLEEFDDTLSGDFIELFTTAPVKKKDAELLSDEEIPTPIENGVIDIGEVVAETLALNIPVFPRKPDAVFTYHSDKEDGDNPFSVLKKLKK